MKKLMYIYFLNIINCLPIFAIIFLGSGLMGCWFLFGIINCLICSGLVTLILVCLMTCLEYDDMVIEEVSKF